MELSQQYRLGRLRKLTEPLAGLAVRRRAAVADVSVVDPAVGGFVAPPAEADWRELGETREWGEKQAYAWFAGRVEVPENWPREKHDRVGYRLRMGHERNYLEKADDDNFAAGPEGQMFLDGERVGAIDHQHETAWVRVKPGHAYDVSAVMFAARCACRHRLNQWAIEWVDLPTLKLHYDTLTALELADQLEDGSPQRQGLLDAVDAAVAALDLREVHHPLAPASARRDPEHAAFYETVHAAQAAFDKTYKNIASDAPRPRVNCVGHAHIDLAWLWPYEVTQHKCVRTFATQCALLDHYPDWIFQQSSPQAYAWVKQLAPDLYDRIKHHVKSGRWEADGATWCEMDTNVPSGESLVRQLLYGKRFFEDEFGVDSRMLWLPDVFGYSGALPQLLKLAGVKGFVTSKISWSQMNRFPHDTFRWKGIDGTAVTTHFITCPVGQVDWAESEHLMTYNATRPVRDVVETSKQYMQRHLGIEPLVTFGHGDGGGGPTETIVERMGRMASWDLPAGVPGARFEKAGDLLKRIDQQAARLPVWDGELYLEYHRGTLTSQAWLKRANRKCEIALHDAEWLASLAGECGHQLDKPAIDRAWQDLMLAQFHDVLPGSSVHEVYEKTRPMMEGVASAAADVSAAAMEVLAEQIDTREWDQPVVMFNTLSWDRTDPFQLPDGRWVDDVTIPAGGWVVVESENPVSVDRDAAPLAVSSDGRQLTNRFWQIRLDEQGRIESLHDRLADREVLPGRAVANRWQVFLDRPNKYDAWELEADFEERPVPGPRLHSIEVAERGGERVAVDLVWHMPQLAPEGESGAAVRSVIRQRIAIYAHSPRIDFETDIDWVDHDMVLKVAFPVKVRATEATYEIQYGHIRRPTHTNTTWDLAKFECCGHRWVDLSESGYGVALLNDCKYGFDIRGNVIRMTCLKSPQRPDPVADRGKHVFRYALLPHAGTFQAAQVVRRAAEFNAPPVVHPIPVSDGRWPAEHRAVTLTSTADAIVLDTLKPAEDGDGWIARLYESHGSHARGSLRFARRVESMLVVDLLEEEDMSAEPIEPDEETGAVKLRMRPFQVLSLRVRF